MATFLKQVIYLAGIIFFLTACNGIEQVYKKVKHILKKANMN